MTKVSIIVPVYNVESYLGECLESILMQDFDEYEIICVEDCSTDHSLVILEEYAKNFDIKIIKNPINRGLSATRNVGIREAKGEYILFVDSDDIIKKSTCKDLYEYGIKNNADIVYYNMEYLNNEAAGFVHEPQCNKDFEGIFSGVDLLCKFQKARTNKFEAVRHFIKREFLLDNELFFYEGILHEDILFSFFAAVKASRVVDLNKELYIYRQRPGSICYEKKEERISSLLLIIINICSYWMQNDFTDEQSYWIYRYLKDLYIGYSELKGNQDKLNLIGNKKEQYVQKLLSLKDNYGISFSDEDIQVLRNSDRVVVYGAGKIANESIQKLKCMNVKIEKIVVTDKTENPLEMQGIQIINLSELRDTTDISLVIGVDTQYWDSIYENISKYTFKRIIYSE